MQKRLKLQRRLVSRNRNGRYAGESKYIHKMLNNLKQMLNNPKQMLNCRGKLKLNADKTQTIQK